MAGARKSGPSKGPGSRGKFFALGRRKWGNSKRVLKAIFERVVSPMVLYGSEIWVERAGDSRVTKQLNAVERPFLRAITRAYTNAPTAASEGIHIADRECDRLAREGTECERVEGVGKGFIKKWRGEKEMREWQARWSGGNTGRWLYTMWDMVNREGAEVTSELVQVATGHGDYRAYLSRFRLNEGDRDVCDCEIGPENVQHVVLDCTLPRRVSAREELTASLGYYPPRLNEVREWQGVKRWAYELVHGKD